ncbi:MAG TPA: hypothetical protein VKG62_08775 [Solirubrobacteraceae bacterium]|nr:hypothetical protein [Solirubrobacteraceae bacterium]
MPQTPDDTDSKDTDPEGPERSRGVSDAADPAAGAGADARDGLQAMPAPPRLPSGRMTAILAAGMLAIGVAVGAAIGPAPSASFAGLPALLPSLISASSGHQSSGSGQAPGSASAAAGSASTPRRRRHRRAGLAQGAAGQTAAAASTEASGEASGEESSSGSSGSGGRSSTIPAATNVWLVQLSGGTFSGAIAQPSTDPYIDGHAIPSGTLLSSWSGLAGGAFATETALLAGTAPQRVDTIIEPPCPEGAAGGSCAVAGSAGALTAADGFLQQTLATITTTSAYREHGLIVIVFGTVIAGSSAGLTAGSSSATLTSTPPSGVLLISPFAKAGARPASAFDPTSPRQSVEALLHR